MRQCQLFHFSHKTYASPCYVGQSSFFTSTQNWQYYQLGIAIYLQLQYWHFCIEASLWDYHYQTVAYQTMRILCLLLQICNDGFLLGNNATVCQIMQMFSGVRFGKGYQTIIAVPEILLRLDKIPFEIDLIMKNSKNKSTPANFLYLSPWSETRRPTHFGLKKSDTR